MHIILSPAKTMAGTSKIKAPAGTTPRFNQEAIEIALHMAQYPAEELGRMLKLSPKLMMESYHRFQNFHSAEEEPLQALLAYTGVVSICYGLLRPLDLIKPYRMEYDVKLPELGEGNMYIYWRARQTEPLIEEVKADDNLLINLGSMDLQPSFDWKKVEQSVRVITPDFKVWKNGKAETIVIYAKMARGQMTRYIVKNRITNPDALKDFTWEGFRYREDISSENNWIFLQD